MRSNARRHCLVCDQLISKQTERRSIFKCSSNMDDVDRGLSDRLEVILDTKLAENQAHSEELCHLCEAQMVQIEEYFRLLIIFRETYRQTVKKHMQSQSLSQLRGKSNRQRKQEPVQSNKESRQKSSDVRFKSLKKKKKTTKSSAKIPRNEKQGKENIKKSEEARTIKQASRECDNDVVSLYLSDYDVDTEDNAMEDDIDTNEVKLGEEITSNPDQSKQPGSMNIRTIESEKQGEQRPENTKQNSDKTQEVLDVTETDDISLLQSRVEKNNHDSPSKNSDEPMVQVQSELPQLPAPIPAPSSNKAPVQTPAKPPLQRFIGKRKFRCMACSKQFATLRNLKRHQKVHSGDHRKTVFPCPACGVKFSHKVSLKGHVKVHRIEGIDIISCRDCPSMFINASDLEEHLREECPRKNPYKCSECNRAYRCKSELEQHKLLHQGQRPFKCEICEKTFTRKQTLNEHKRVHLDVKPYKCDLCPDAFNFRSNLKEHKLRHSESRPHQCPICTASFAGTASLQNHLKVHRSENPFLCSVCGRGFKQTSTLQLHLRVHSSDRPFKCVTCEASFKRADILQRHMLTHTGGTPYKCTECHLSYRDRKSYRDHFLTHKKIKPFTCGTCHKSFVDKKVLHKHEKLHTGEKAYKCSICEKAFALPQYLRRHVKTHNKGLNSGTKKKRAQKGGLGVKANICSQSPEGDANINTTSDEPLERIEIVNIETSEVTLETSECVELPNETLTQNQSEAYPEEKNSSIDVLQNVPSPKEVTSMMSQSRCISSVALEFVPPETLSADSSDMTQRYIMMTRLDDKDGSVSQVPCHLQAGRQSQEDLPLTSAISTISGKGAVNYASSAQEMEVLLKKQEQEQSNLILQHQGDDEAMSYLTTISISSRNKPIPLPSVSSQHPENVLPNTTEMATTNHHNIRLPRPLENVASQPTDMVISRSQEIITSQTSKMMVSHNYAMMMSHPQEMMMSHDPGMMTARSPEMMTSLPKDHPLMYSRGDFMNKRNSSVTRNDGNGLDRKSPDDFQRQMSMVVSMQRDSDSTFSQAGPKEPQFIALSKEALLSNQKEIPSSVNRENSSLYQRNPQLHSHSFILSSDSPHLGYNYQESNQAKGPYLVPSEQNIVNYSMHSNPPNQLQTIQSVTMNSKMPSSSLPIPSSYQSHPQCLTVASTHQTSTSSLYHLNENIGYSRPLPPHPNILNANPFPVDNYNQTLNLKTVKDNGLGESPSDTRFFMGPYGPPDGTLMSLPGLGFSSNNSSITGSGQEGDYSLMNNAYTPQHGHIPVPGNDNNQRHVPVSSLVQDLQKKS